MLNMLIQDEKINKEDTEIKIEKLEYPDTYGIKNKYLLI